MADELASRAMSPGDPEGLQESTVRFCSCPWDVTAVQEDRLGTDCVEGFARCWKRNVRQQHVLVALKAGLSCWAVPAQAWPAGRGKGDVPLLGTWGHIWNAVPGLGSLGQYGLCQTELTKVVRAGACDV